MLLPSCIHSFIPCFLPSFLPLKIRLLSSKYPSFPPSFFPVLPTFLPLGLTVLQDTVHEHANSKLGLDIATWLLSKGVDADSAGRSGGVSGTVPLYVAAELDDLAMVQLLLDHGADPNRLTSLGGGNDNSPLYL